MKSKMLLLSVCALSLFAADANAKTNGIAKTVAAVQAAAFLDPVGKVVNKTLVKLPIDKVGIGGGKGSLNGLLSSGNRKPLAGLGD